MGNGLHMQTHARPIFKLVVLRGPGDSLVFQYSFINNIFIVTVKKIKKALVVLYKKLIYLFYHLILQKQLTSIILF